MAVQILDEECDKWNLVWVDSVRRAERSDASAWGRHPIKDLFSVSLNSTCEEWPFSVGNLYDPSRRAIRAFKWHDRRRRIQAASRSLQVEFEKLAAQWRRETRLSSSVDEKVLHPAYQSIIAMGTRAVPWVLADLKANRGHWFWALHFMTGADPVPEGANVSEARQAWLDWGTAKGLLK